MVNAKGESTFVKFHWRPAAGSASVIWDEAVKLSGADPDFHRRDLFEAIDKGDFPEYEFCIQSFDQRTADGLDFDILDPTKLIPEEVIPLEVIGRMVLDRNADNFFAETEQAAYHPGNVVPGPLRRIAGRLRPRLRQGLRLFANLRVARGTSKIPPALMTTKTSVERRR